MNPCTRAATFGTGKAPRGAESAWRSGDQMFVDVVWRHGRIDLMLSPLWVHIVGVDMLPAARLMRRMELDLARWHQQALMGRAASLPGRVERLAPGRAACRRHGHTVRADEEPMH